MWLEIQKKRRKEGEEATTNEGGFVKKGEKGKKGERKVRGGDLEEEEEGD